MASGACAEQGDGEYIDDFEQNCQMPLESVWVEDVF